MYSEWRRKGNNTKWSCMQLFLLHLHLGPFDSHAQQLLGGRLDGVAAPELRPES
jgi:hypothetical protein